MERTRGRGKNDVSVSSGNYAKARGSKSESLREYSTRTRTFCLFTDTRGPIRSIKGWHRFNDYFRTRPLASPLHFPFLLHYRPVIPPNPAFALSVLEIIRRSQFFPEIEFESRRDTPTRSSLRSNLYQEQASSVDHLPTNGPSFIPPVPRALSAFATFSLRHRALSRQFPFYARFLHSSPSLRRDPPI